MGDKRLMVDDLSFEFEGVFKAKDMFGLVTTWFWDRGWDIKPGKEHSFHTPTGLSIEWYNSMWKKISDYIRLEMKITILVLNMQKKTIEVDGKPVEINEGKIVFNLNGYIEYDYDMRWDQRPMFIFLRSVMDKYVHASYTKKFEQLLIDDCNELYGQVQKFLNIYNAPLASQPMSTVHQKEEGHH